MTDRAGARPLGVGRARRRGQKGTIEAGEIRTLLEGGAHERYVPSGHIVYARGG